MRRRIRALILFGIFAIAALSVIFTGCTPTPPAIAFDYFPLNQTQLIDIRPNDEHFQKLTEREKKDQLRDWLIFTIASDKSFSAEQINNSLYDQPTIRYGYLNPVSNFDYGDIRSVYVGSNRVVALLPKGVSSAQRIDSLAHIADRHRQNVGKTPQKIYVFEYELNLNRQFALLTRTQEVDAKEIFSDKNYGYREASIKSLKDLENFIQQVDDITFANTKKSHLILGGRKIFGHPYRGITVENIATIWQSEKKINDKIVQLSENLALQYPDLNLAELQKKLAEEVKKQKLVFGSGFSLDPSFDYQGIQESLENAKPLLQSLIVNGKPVISTSEIKEAKAGLAKSDSVPYLKLIDKLQRNLNNEAIYQKIQQETLGQVKSEVSKLKEEINQKIDEYQKQLDAKIKEQVKEYDLQLDNEFSLKRNELEKSGRPGDKIQQEWQDFIESKKQARQNFVNELSNSYKAKLQQFINDNNLEYQNRISQIQRSVKLKDKELSEKINRFVDTPINQKFQAARYDGELQGTEVGMVLFYTDLLAKLWGFDYAQATPEEYIQGFKPKTKIAVSSIYQDELKKLSNTRTWFEPSKKGFQVIDSGNSLVFARNSTKVSARSANALNLKDEKQANAVSDTFLNWWNANYEEVARYEPQYERLNEIMKWSLLISWLNQSDKGDYLSFLKDVSVTRNNWFSSWLQANKEQLKFKHWDTQLCPDGWNNDPEKPKQPICFYRQGYKGTKTEAMPILKSDLFKSFGEDKHYLSGGVSLAERSTFSQRIPLPYSSEINELSLRSNIDYASIQSADNSISFRTLEETAYNLKKISSSETSVSAKAKEGVKLRSPEVELNNLEFTRNVSRTDNGIEIKSTIDSTNLGSFSTTKTENRFTVGWQSREIDTAHSLALELSKQKGKLKEILLSDSRIDAVGELPTASGYLVQLKSSDKWLELTPEAGGAGAGKPPWKSRVAATPADDGDPSFLKNHALNWIDDGDIKGKKVKWIRSESGSSESKSFARDFEAHQYKQLAEKVAKNPESFNKIFDNYLSEVDRLIQTNQFTQATQKIDALNQIFGAKPELSIRRGLVGIKQARIKVREVKLTDNRTIVETSKTTQNNFFREMTARLKRKFKRISKDNANIYVEDNPGLNNLDWNQPIESVVSSTPLKSKVYQLESGRIGDKKLSDMGAETPPNQQPPIPPESQRYSGSFNPRNPFYTSGRSVTASSSCYEDEDDKDGVKFCKEKTDREKDTYIIVAP